MAKQYVIAVDFGTTGSRTVVFDLQGNEVGSAYKENHITYPEPNSFEYDGQKAYDTFYETTAQAIKKSGIDPHDIIAVSFDAMRGCLAMYDENGKQVHPLLIWPDTRAFEMEPYMTSQLEKAGISLDELYDMTAFPFNVGWPTTRILYLRKRWPEKFQKITRISTLQAFMTYAFCGEYVDDAENCGWFQLFDPKTCKPLAKVAEAWELDVSKFTAYRPAGSRCGSITKACAGKTGLIEGTPVIVGCGDQQCGAVGSGNVSEGIASVVIGSVSVSVSRIPELVLDPNRISNIVGAPGGAWQIEATSSTAGAAFRWFRDLCCGEEEAYAKANGMSTYDALTAKAATSPVGANGITFLPYLTGATTPHFNDKARAAYLGMGMSNVKEDLIRATMEGVTFTAKENLDAVAAVNNAVFNTYRVGGGAANSDFWNQMVADVFGGVVENMATPETTALGTAMIAAVGVGAYKNLQEAADNMVKITKRFEPITQNVAAYKELYAQFKDYYKTLAKGDCYANANRLQQKYAKTVEE